MLELELTEDTRTLTSQELFPCDGIVSPVADGDFEELESTPSSPSKPKSGNQSYTRNLVISVLQALLGAFLIGWNLGCLNVPHDVIQHEVTGMTDPQWGLLNSMMCIGGMMGALSAGPLQDKYGRKKAMLLMDAVFIVSAVETFLYADGDLNVDPRNSDGFILFWMGRLLAGIACGIALSVVPTYLGEIAPLLIRGTIVTTFQLTVCFSIIWTSFLGYHKIIGGPNTWQTLFLPNAIPLIQILTAFSFPESPKWLFQQGRSEEAKLALQHLRMTTDVKDEIEMDQIKVEMNSNSNKSTKDDVLLQDIALEDCGEPNVAENIKLTKFGIPESEYQSVKWAMIIACVLMWMQHLSGINAVMYYSSVILEDAGITSDKGKWLGTTAIMVANFMGVIVALFVVDRVGRKTLMVISGSICVITLLLVSIAILMNESHGGLLWSYSSIVFLVLFVVGFEIGLGPIPWTIIAETSPMQFRGTILSVATFMNWTGNLLIAQCSAMVMSSPLKLFPFAIFTFLGIMFTIRIIPETRGKSTVEIQKALTNVRLRQFVC